MEIYIKKDAKMEKKCVDKLITRIVKRFVSEIVSILSFSEAGYFRYHLVRRQHLYVYANIYFPRFT